MPDQKLSIQIETTATGQGVQQTASGLQQLSGAAKQAAPAVGALGNQSKATAQELGRGVEVGNAASMMVQNLASSTKGGAAGFLSLARGAFGAGVALKGVMASLGPFGAIAAGVGIAIGLITAALRKNEEAAEAQKKKLEEVNQQKLDKAIEEQSKLGRAAGEAVQQIEAERAAIERIADAELALRKSRIDADKSLSEEEKARQKLALDRKREEEKRAGILADEEVKARKLADASFASQKLARAAEAEYARQKNALAEVTAATKALADAQAMVDLPENAGGQASAEDYAALVAARARKRRADAQATGVSQDTLKDSEAAAKEMRKKADADLDRSEAARTGADLEYTTQREEDRRRRETQRNEDRANRPETEAEKTAREKAKAKAEASIGNFGLSVWQARAVGGMVDPDTLEALKKRYPKAEFRTPSSESAPLTPASPYTAQPGGGALPATTTGVYRGALPSDGRPIPGVYAAGAQLPSAAPGAGNQLTFGKLQPGSDNKDPKTAEALKGTTEATKEADTGDATAKAAEELKKTTEEHAKAVKDSAQKTDSALGSAKQALSAASGALSEHNQRLSEHSAELRRIWGAISALRSSKG